MARAGKIKNPRKKPTSRNKYKHKTIGELAFDQHANLLPSVKFRPIFLQQMQWKRAHNSIHSFPSEQEEGRTLMFDKAF